VYYRLKDNQLNDLLALLVGPLTKTELDMLDGCNCPNCSMVLLTEIE
jgi:hypothetical protein